MYFHFLNQRSKDLKQIRKQKKITREEIPSMEEKDRMKYEIAEELGLLDQVLEEGWKSLSSKETGRIGGLMTRRRRKSAEDPA